ncbi:uncharacterized protein LOC110104046 [Dendrobium catenatum]|uniref:uncharacterized protein LOC110104046 n=1 Tax=Dendrobium catenatum TaxID=906689 RepID=UPI0009F163FA|nr:uncharacterized protein LOC110104046 [Dendrobium catenatum]
MASIDRRDVNLLIGMKWDFFHVLADGLSRGIMVLWKKNMASFKVQESSSQFVVGELEVVNKGKWKIGTIYVSRDTYSRSSLWGRLEYHVSKEVPMIVGGNFNYLLSREEKKGGRDFVYSLGNKQMKSFITCIDLHEVESIGPKFTWCNNKKGAERILEKLDSCLLNSVAMNLSQWMVVRHLARIASDHYPILLNLLEFNKISKKQIKFEEVWASCPTSVTVAKKAWWRKVCCSLPHILNQKMNRALKALFNWSKAKYKELNQLKDELKKQILELQTKDAVIGFLNEEEAWLLKWRQRAKVKWIKEGDSNTRFFHAYASARRNINFIHKIKDENGLIMEDQIKVENVLNNYFNEKWKERECSLLGWPKQWKTLSIEDSLVLSIEFTIEDMEKVIQELGPNNAPGKNGISYSFLKA